MIMPSHDTVHAYMYVLITSAMSINCIYADIFAPVLYTRIQIVIFIVEIQFHQGLNIYFGSSAKLQQSSVKCH